MRAAWFAICLGLAACAAPNPQTAAINPNPPPPPLRIDTPGTPPVTGQTLIWRPGYWSWNGQGSYSWVEGEYEPMGNHGTSWTYGYWDYINGYWTWVPAHWS
jgi:hypothetical protein